MSLVLHTTEIFDSLRKNIYTIKIEDGTVISLQFNPENYHHLAGFQHLTDMPSISSPMSTRKFYSDVKRGLVTDEIIQKSAKYSEMQQRIETFDSIIDMLHSESAKVIVDFDASLLNTKIDADYFLFKRIGNTDCQSFSYHHLFIGRNGSGKSYPATYIVENSRLYIAEQSILNCSISILKKR